MGKMLKIGQTIICIDDAKQPHTREELEKDVRNWIKKGEKYTIRAIHDFDFVLGILLEEVRNDLKYFKVVNKTLEPAFASWRFRALKESEKEVETEVEQLATGR